MNDCIGGAVPAAASTGQRVALWTGPTTRHLHDGRLQEIRLCGPLPRQKLGVGFLGLASLLGGAGAKAVGQTALEL